MHAPGVEGRLYSGATGSTRSTTRNRVPVTLLDLKLAPGARFQQDLPASYNGFVYVVEGSASIGGRAVESVTSAGLRPCPRQQRTGRRAGAHGARLVLYAGQPDPRAAHPARPVRRRLAHRDRRPLSALPRRSVHQHESAGARPAPSRSRRRDVRMTLSMAPLLIASTDAPPLPAGPCAPRAKPHPRTDGRTSKPLPAASTGTSASTATTPAPWWGCPTSEPADRRRPRSLAARISRQADGPVLLECNAASATPRRRRSCPGWRSRSGRSSSPRPGGDLADAAPAARPDGRLPALPGRDGRRSSWRRPATRTRPAAATRSTAWTTPPRAAPSSSMPAPRRDAGRRGIERRRPRPRRGRAAAPTSPRPREAAERAADADHVDGVQRRHDIGARARRRRGRRRGAR